MADTVNGPHEVIDRVVRHRSRTVSTGVRDFKAIVLRKLFGSQDAEHDALALGVEIPVDALGDRECGIDLVAGMLGEPAGTVQGAARFLAAGQGELDCSGRPEALLPVANQVVDPDGGLGLHIGHATGVEVAVFFDELERVPRPVLAFGLDHVDMSEHQDRACLRVGAAQDREQAAFPGVTIRSEYAQVRFRIAGRAQSGRHTFSRQRAVTDRERRIGLDQLLEDVPESRLAAVRRDSVPGAKGTICEKKRQRRGRQPIVHCSHSPAVADAVDEPHYVRRQVLERTHRVL